MSEEKKTGRKSMLDTKEEAGDTERLNNKPDNIYESEQEMGKRIARHLSGKTWGGSNKRKGVTQYKKKTN